MAIKKQIVRDPRREELIAKVKAACKASDIDDSSAPQFWYDRVNLDVPVIPTPSPGLNAAIGIGGIPFGRIVEIYGTESSGKTTLALQLIAKAQKDGRDVAFIDMAQSLDPAYVEALGVNMSEVFFSQPASGDDALILAKIFAECGMGLIVIDDVPSMASKAELEKEITDNNIGLQARMMSQGLRQIQPILRANKCTLIFINQIREKIGVMYGNPETTPGGRALKFFASMRIEMRATSKRTETATTVKVKVVKNKLAPPYRDCEISIIYGKGIDGSAETYGIACELGVINKRGAWFILPRLDCPGMVLVDEKEELKFHGEESAQDFILQTVGYFDALTVAVTLAQKALLAPEPVLVGAKEIE
jgi:recombination protein RecA